MAITDIRSYNANRGLFGPSSIEKRVSYMLEGTRREAYSPRQPDGKVIELNGAPLRMVAATLLPVAISLDT